ncbi:DNA oxidative demethylase ALKBH2 [Lachnellula suecica]|uniref:DNA oxidative demethylase ALKBH2 n=1 Tax=Lachnellula suecica TaxID=602035 RepID=A0A8T9C7U3_9HELO|nr:DNA oxidative demethylase ALKBH2 [Lachnellula suecica]
MFEINEQNIPFVQTRQALIVLDTQNDFVSTGCLLPVDSPPDYLDKILELIPAFRASQSNIIWIRSLFEVSRPVNEASGDSESVITDAQLLPAHRRSEKRVRQEPSQKLLELQSRIALSNGRALDSEIDADDEVDVDEIEETFLTIPEGQIPRMVLPASTGSNLPQAAVDIVDVGTDLFIKKTHYSAFRDGTLVQTLRAKFVTEIYLVGCLTNISIFATAMDAAQHGYAITVVEDCLGYRSKARHDEALRRLTEFTGCEIITSEDLIIDMQRKELMQSIPSRRNPRRRENGANLEGMMANMNLRSDRKPSTRSRPPESTGTTTDVAGGHGGSSDSVATSESPPDKAEVEAKKRERVKTKIKTRRRLSKSIPKEIGVSGDKVRNLPTSVTLLGVSQALEKIPKPLEEEGDILASRSSPDALSEVPDTVYTERPRREVEDGCKMQTKDPKLVCKTSNPEKYSKISMESSGAPICEGDTTVIQDLLDEELADGIFEKLRDEVRWQKMSHLGGDVPRLVAVQGRVADDGSIPIYRHPADESPPLLPFSSTVSLIQAKVEETLGHPVNHVLIQFYRGGQDYISEHSDKTLDIVPKTFIANVSLGAQRTMVFRTKRPLKIHDDEEASEPLPPRQICRAPLPHNSLCKVGLITNMRWLHAIRQDKRMASEKSPEELAFDGGRISLTFRQIGTFLNKDETKIWGQGAVAKSKEAARTVLNGETAGFDNMLKAFGRENQATEFNWADSYGQGFDVLHMSNSPKLFLSGDAVLDLRVKLPLALWNIPWAEGKLSPSFNWKNGSSSSDASPIPENLPVKFVDNDLSKSTVTGDLAIMLYLDSVHGQKSEASYPADIARQFTRFQQSGDLLDKWRAEPFSVKPFKKALDLWDSYAAEAPFIAGSRVSLADFAVWPVLHDISKEWPDFDGLENLNRYYEFLKSQDYVVKGAALEKGKAVEETAA